MSENTKALSTAGVSIWLDDLSRDRLETGNLAELIETRDIVGVTTNPTIFASALADGDRYAADVEKLKQAGADVDETIEALTTADVAAACDVFAGLYRSTGGIDGRVSIEVSPLLANDAAATVTEAQRLHERVARENVLIKIPATQAGLQAIADVTALGISVNVTLIFSLARYRDVINAYLTGLERAKEAGHDLSKIHSVASFFVSRVDSEVDGRLAKLGTEEASALIGKTAVANARLAYRVFEEEFASERAQQLLEAGANAQRPLWASTGVKNPDFPDTMYVTELVAANVVNTMPEKTLEAVSDHGEVTGDTVTGTYEDAEKVLDAIAAEGIDYVEVTELLEREGVDKFEVSWTELVETVQKQLDAAGEKDSQ
ncbi:transaldolase [Agrococcus casei]|uniref:transaldolase n=1 Tax=Agrococcus casei TaxID=343512 RepID=UPI003F92F01D